MLGSAVSIVVLAAVVLIFYPRVSRWMADSEDSVVGRPPDPAESMPVWVGRTTDGVAFLLERGAGTQSDGPLADALEGGPWHYMTLWVYNFEREAPYVLEIPDGGYASPEGGPAVLPAAPRLRRQAPDHVKAILHGLGAIGRFEIAQGHFARVLLLVKEDAARRTAFIVRDGFRLERREVARGVLATWRERPDWDEFKDF